MVATTVKDLLVVNNRAALIAEFYSTMIAKYELKRLGQPNEFLGRSVSSTAYGSIFLNQTELVYTIMGNGGMKHVNGRYFPFNYSKQLHFPCEGDTFQFETAEKYRDWSAT